MMTLTLENMPTELDKELRRRARAEGKRMDEIVLDVIKAGLAAGKRPTIKKDRNRSGASSKSLASVQLRELNKKLNGDPRRMMRLAEANARRIAGKPNL